MADHKTVMVCCGAVRIPIDAKLAPLIPLLWHVGIKTEQCCEEHWPGLARVVFPSTFDACLFLFIAQADYRVEVETWDEGEPGGRRAPHLNLYVIFPTADISHLVKVFRRVKEIGLESYLAEDVKARTRKRKGAG
jgi:hypothetical protein